MTIDQLRSTLTTTHQLSDERAEFVVAQTLANGYCPFITGGRQFAATSFKHSPGFYAINQEGSPDSEQDQ